MIPFGSQRGYGADLATHLMNAQDNEYVELFALRGAIAEDLHGAFAEWEAEAHAMTKAKNYLYSLSINPDPAQGRLAREHYEDYIERVEESLGLFGQPRAVVFHIKESQDGHLREHCHVIWSRIDVQEQKAIPIAFDHRKLMMVTRQFALDHGLKLPEGYETGQAQSRQLSLYEKVQGDVTGLTRDERVEIITDLWRQCDTPQAFVAALDDYGFMLANGRRPYVLVDIHGTVNALPRMIDDKDVRAKDVEAFLGNVFPPDQLPSVDEAKALAERHSKERAGFQKSEKHREQLEILKRSQDMRRKSLADEIEAKKCTHQLQSDALKNAQRVAQEALSSQHAEERFRIEFDRTQNAPTGLAAFLAKVSGIELVRQTLHKREDRKREERHCEECRHLREEQLAARRVQDHAQQLQMMELRRKQHAMEQVFKREALGLRTAEKKEQALRYRKTHRPAPGLALAPGPKGRPAMPHKAKSRFYLPTVNDPNVKTRLPPIPSPPVAKPERPVILAPYEIKRPATVKPEGGIPSPKPGRDKGRKR